MNIGDWITRERRGVPHLVESIVAGDVVTRCGRRLSDEPTKSGGGLVRLVTIVNYPKCRTCER